MIGQLNKLIDMKITVVSILDCGQNLHRSTPFRVLHTEFGKALEATLIKGTKMFLPIKEDNLNCEPFQQVSYENLFAEVVRNDKGIERIRVIIK